MQFSNKNNIPACRTFWNSSSSLTIVIPSLLLTCRINSLPAKPSQMCCALLFNYKYVSLSPFLFVFVFICGLFCSETFSFMLTGEDGSRRFGYCRRLLVSSHSAPHPLHQVQAPLSPVCCYRRFYLNMRCCFPVGMLTGCVIVCCGNRK